MKTFDPPKEVLSDSTSEWTAISLKSLIPDDTAYVLILERLGNNGLLQLAASYDLYNNQGNYTTVGLEWNQSQEYPKLACVTRLLKLTDNKEIYVRGFNRPTGWLPTDIRHRIFVLGYITEKESVFIKQPPPTVKGLYKAPETLVGTNGKYPYTDLDELFGGIDYSYGVAFLYNEKKKSPTTLGTYAVRLPNVSAAGSKGVYYVRGHFSYDMYNTSDMAIEGAILHFGNEQQERYSWKVSNRPSDPNHETEVLDAAVGKYAINMRDHMQESVLGYITESANFTAANNAIDVTPYPANSTIKSANPSFVDQIDIGTVSNILDEAYISVDIDRIDSPTSAINRVRILDLPIVPSTKEYFKSKIYYDPAVPPTTITESQLTYLAALVNTVALTLDPFEAVDVVVDDVRFVGATLPNAEYLLYPFFSIDRWSAPPVDLSGIKVYLSGSSTSIIDSSGGAINTTELPYTDTAITLDLRQSTAGAAIPRCVYIKNETGGLAAGIGVYLKDNNSLTALASIAVGYTEKNSVEPTLPPEGVPNEINFTVSNTTATALQLSPMQDGDYIPIWILFNAPAGDKPLTTLQYQLVITQRS